MLKVTPKPRLFVGSSAEGLPQAKAIQNNLNRRAQVTLWSQGVFKLNKTALQSLQEHLEKTDFAVFIFSPDDRTLMRGSDLATARDNCIFELGLSLGKLGNDRAFFVKPRGYEDFHIPTPECTSAFSLLSCEKQQTLYYKLQQSPGKLSKFVQGFPGI